MIGKGLPIYVSAHPCASVVPYRQVIGKGLPIYVSAHPWFPGFDNSEKPPILTRMKAFAHLFETLEQARTPSEKVEALTRYFTDTPPADAAWAVHLLKGGGMPRPVPARSLREWVTEKLALPPWLLEACHAETGDLAETLSLLWPERGAGLDLPFHKVLEEHLLPLRDADPETQRTSLFALWDDCTRTERLLVNKILLGGMRVNVDRGLTAKALAEFAGLDPALVEHRLMTDVAPTANAFQTWIASDNPEDPLKHPYPFFLATSLTTPVSALIDPHAWQVEWHWDGIRAQLIRRGGETLLWSRDEELLSDAFPEIIREAGELPDGTVLDGVILAWHNESPLPFGELQRRIQKKNPGPKLQNEIPVVFLAVDCMEIQGVDIREMPLYSRVCQVVPMFGIDECDHFRVSEPLKFETWADLEALRIQSRQRGATGLMLKRLDSPYREGRVPGDWWKWSAPPHTLNAVLLYVQVADGNQPGAFAHLTFGLWENGELVTFAKCSDELSPRERSEVDEFVRRNTLEKHGPVRVVKPEWVGEIAFDGLWPSKRHKSGIAIRSPKLLRLHPDKSPEAADSLESLRSLLS